MVEDTRQTPQQNTWKVVGRVLFKALALFLVFNLLYVALQPLPTIGRASIYNVLVPGRPRLPFGENPAEAYNFSTFQLDVMFDSHQAAVPPHADEFRVLTIGDSSVWGFLLRPDDTLAGNLNALDLTTPDGRPVRVYNVGYPTISVTKDLLILSHALDAYDPDLIVWLTTLEALPPSKQTSSPIVQHNPQDVRPLINQYDLAIDPHHPDFVEPTLGNRTLMGQRRELADVLRLNLYGFMWAATSIDQFYPAEYTPRAEDLPPDEEFYGLTPPLAASDLAFDVLAAGVEMTEDVPVLLINEPMFVSMGENNDIRYNFFYPRWAYDAYRDHMAAQAAHRGWHYVDLWDAIDNTEFTNSAIHLTPAGSAQLATHVANEIGRLLADQ